MKGQAHRSYVVEGAISVLQTSTSIFLWYLGNTGGKFRVQVYLHKNLPSACRKRSIFNA